MGEGTVQCSLYMYTYQSKTLLTGKNNNNDNHNGNNNKSGIRDGSISQRETGSKLVNWRKYIENRAALRAHVAKETEHFCQQHQNDATMQAAAFQFSQSVN